MNRSSLLVLPLLLLLAPLARAADLADVSGIKDSCAAGALLDASGIPYQVVVLRAGDRSEAGCIYEVEGTRYLYTPSGSAKVIPSQMAKVPLEHVSRADVFRISDGSRRIDNGCLVFATCTFAQYRRDPHIRWAGIIAAQVVNINNFGGDSGTQLASPTGHAISAYETDDRRVFIQENGESPREAAQMTALARAGDKSWYDSGALMYCDHRIQGFTSFKGQFGRPL